MRIVFLGTPDFAVATLKALLEAQYNIVAVITAPDRIGGRGRNQIIESPVKVYALQRQLTILQPTNLKSPKFLSKLRALNADIQVVVAFRMLPVAVWEMPPLGTYNLHGSLLPAYRGAAPINWAIIRGEAYTGVSTFKLKHDIDTGSIALQAKVPIYKSDDVGTVHDRMMIIGAQLMVETLALLFQGTLRLQAQDNSLVSHAPKIFHEDCALDLHKTPYELYNHVRGLSPYPLAWIVLNDKKVKVISITYTYDIHTQQEGSISSDGKNYIAIACDQGWIFLERIKPEGKGAMDVKDFLNGHQLTPNMSRFVTLSELIGQGESPLR